MDLRECEYYLGSFWLFQEVYLRGHTLNLLSLAFSYSVFPHVNECVHLHKFNILSELNFEGNGLSPKCIYSQKYWDGIDLVM